MQSNRSIVLSSVALISIAAGRASAGVIANQVIDYTQGATTSSAVNSNSALGPITGNTGYGSVTPFNPPYSASQIVVVGAGGQITVKMASPLMGATPGATLGVFSNNGIDDTSGNGSGLAGNPAVTFNDPAHPTAIVSVSSDGANYIPLNNGNPIVFANPTNYYADGPAFTNDKQSPGTIAANQFQPFTGTLASFNGETYSQILTTLNGSAGGTWLDISGAGLAAINDIRFNVPAGDTFVLDSVAAVPEPVTMLPLLGFTTLIGRRKRAR